MPAKKKSNTYVIEHKKFKCWKDAVGFAADLSLTRDDPVTITEYGQTGTYYISIEAKSEEA